MRAAHHAVSAARTGILLIGSRVRPSIGRGARLYLRVHSRSAETSEHLRGDGGWQITGEGHHFHHSTALGGSNVSASAAGGGCCFLVALTVEGQGLTTWYLMDSSWVLEDLH